MKRIWYRIKQGFYPLRLAFYWFRSFMVFITRPGARSIIAVLVVVAGLLLRTIIDPLIGGTITDFAAAFHPGFVYDYRIEIAFSLLFITIYMSVGVLSWFVAPAVSALPAPKRPLPPLPPLVAKKHTVPTVRASVAIEKPSRGSFRGDPATFAPLLPETIQKVLRRPPEAAQEEPPPFMIPSQAEPSLTPAVAPTKRPPSSPRPSPPSPPPQPPRPSSMRAPPAPGASRSPLPPPPELFQDD